MFGAMNLYRRAGVAVTFSPRLEAVVAEARVFAKRCRAELEIVHAGAKDKEKADRLKAAANGNTIHWVPCERAVDGILAATKRNRYNLLVAGALARDGDDIPFSSGVARELIRHAPCDVLLLPVPDEKPHPARHIVFAIEAGSDCQKFLRRVVAHLRPERVTLTTAETPFAAALAASKGEKPRDTEAWLASLVAALPGGITAETRVVNSNTGYSLYDAVQGMNADLLVVMGVRGTPERPFPAHLNWLMQVIPTRLLVVRETR